MPSLTWYTNRLKKMRPTELPYRLGQALKKKYDKHLTGPLEGNGFYEHRANFQKIEVSRATSVFPDLEMQIVKHTKNVLSHRFNVFGMSADFGHPINWHLDPKTGNQWPLIFWGDIDYRYGKRIGGIKFAWELNRLHHLPRLAMAFSLTGDPKYKDEIFNQLASWLESNPYPRGINWISGMEMGIRLVNLVYTLKFLVDESLTAAQQELILKFVSLHGKHLHRYPSAYSSCANHAIAEALGMFAAGLCFPHVDGAAKWKEFGKNLLEREVARQIYRDGSSFEHSIPYLQFILDHYFVYFLLCQQHGEHCGKNVSERLKASLEFIACIVDTNRNFPFIGDGDDGYLLKLNMMEQNNFVSLLNTGAIIFNNPDWILEDAPYDLKTYCLLGAESKVTWKILKKQTKRQDSGCRYFEDAGLAVIRNKQYHDVLFVGNSGRLGLEPLGAHGHADALSFWLSVNGKPIIVDPGTYLYHSRGKWRNYFRSTSAHSTIRVDEQDQAPIVSDFMFGRFYGIKDARLEESGDIIIWSAGHDGYMRLKDPVFHKRTVTYLKEEGRFIIEDLLYGNDRHQIECFFHFHPDCLATLSDCIAIVQSGQIKLKLELDKKWECCRFVRGQVDPPLGWYSPSFNKIKKSYTLLCRKNTNCTERFRSIILLQ